MVFGRHFSFAIFDDFLLGIFKFKAGNGRTPARVTMFFGNGVVTPGLSRECGMIFFVKGQPKCAQQLCDSTVAARRVQSVTVPSF